MTGYSKPDTSKFYVTEDLKPNYNVTFSNKDGLIGTLDFNGPKMVFTGNAEESAERFIEWVSHYFQQRLEQERHAERERLSQPKYEFECPRCGHCCQQREWVGLTDDEYMEAIKGKEDIEDCWQAIEAKLKEKNT